MDEPEHPSSESALGLQFAGISASLRHFFRRRGVEPQEIDDLVQEVGLRLATRGSLDALENLRGYAFQTAASVLVDRSRRRAVRHHGDHVELDPERRASDELGPDRIVAGREALGFAVAALTALPERTRTIFVLRRLEGMRFRDIAARLGISVSAVEKHMVRAVEHLLASGDQR